MPATIIIIQLKDDDKIFDGEPPDVLWEQFASVATDLLERIQSCMTVSNTPVLLSSDDDPDEIMAVAHSDDLWGSKFKKWLQE